MTNLRSTTNIFLVGNECSQILGSKLPSNKQALCAFFHNHRTVKLSVRESAALVIQEISVFWAKARIPVQLKQRCILKVEKLHQEWKALLKSKGKTNQKCRDNEIAFMENLDNVFDIAHSNALGMMTIEMDKQFLESQRQKGRPGCMLGDDVVLNRKENRKAQREMDAESRKQKHSDVNIAGTQVEFISEMTSSSGSESDTQNAPSLFPVVASMEEEARPLTTRGRKSFLTPRLLSALDKWKISADAAMHLITAVADALGHNINEYALNTKTLSRLRKKNAEDTAKTAKRNLQVLR